MLIVSWNVAGLSTTVNRIVQFYGDESKRRKDPSAVIGDFFRRHKADIICIQEAKISKSSLENRSDPFGCARVTGYESFWSCCIDSSKRGFNGVVTYCKNGTVISADSRPLKNPDLDDQGRCVMTDHGSFVLFNVYAPAGGGQPLDYKMKFLNSLRRAMKSQREQHKKKVILVGDLNITHAKRDLFWGSCKLNINQICKEVQDVFESQENRSGTTSSKSVLQHWKHDLANKWPKIEATLQSKHPHMVITTNPRTKERFEKYRMKVKVDGKQILLGNHEEKPEYCEHKYDFDASYYICPGTLEQVLSQERNLVSVTTVAELMLKLGRIEWDENLLQSIVATDGMVSHAFPPRKWLNQIIETDEMIDCFRYFYPNAEGRFTCWDQCKNKRYENQGARIDFTLLDKSLSQYLRKGDVNSLRCSGYSSEQSPESATAALSAATANGMYRPVSFAGGGIMDASQTTLDTQFGIPHTGHIYTPPSFSDHIAVSVLFDDSICSQNLELRANDKSTRASQPHKKVRSINSYFGAQSNTKNDHHHGIPTNALSKEHMKNKKMKVKKEKRPIHTYFRSKSKIKKSVKRETGSK
mmetsp:Transcript_10636/g.25600  ORF Transcript_10636/g.25600 Transcript_10636/m.25600 type:complete len:583 (-) Transcript_10636:81-1829(-)